MDGDNAKRDREQRDSAHQQVQGLMRHQDVIQSQVKTKERVRDLAEVYTHKREVDAMLDLVPDMFPSREHPRNISRTFLEPACGSGNFLVAILERKLAYVTNRLYRSQPTLETAVLKALSSIYGIDIDEGNVTASRGFLLAETAHHANLHLPTVPVTEGFWGAVEAILANNIIRADTLKDSKTIRLIEWHWERQTGYVTRTWVPLDESDQFDLFAQDDKRERDAAPVHYTELSQHTGPRGNQ